MTGERRTRRKHWTWLVLVWLGAFLMLGALSLPVQAAGRFVAPAALDASGRGDVAGRLRAALADQGYVVTSVGLDGDNMAGVIMQPVSPALDDVAWQQLRAGWQALADAYPQASWLLSGVHAGERYLVCFLVPRLAPLSAGRMGIYDTLLDRWVQHKDFAHKDFGTPASSSGSALMPIPALAQDAPPLPATSEVSPDDLEAQPVGPDRLPTLDRLADHITMRVEDRRRLVEPGNTHPLRWHVTAASGDALPVPSPDPGWIRSPAFRREVLTAARWCKRTYAADSQSQDADEDPTDDPPPVTHPLLISPLTFDTTLSLDASFPLVTTPDPIVRLRIAANVTSQKPRYLLAWPALRIRPPPGFAPSANVLPLDIIPLS